MLCPYCASEVSQAAIVCPHCTRDFYLFKPLLERIEQLEARLIESSQAAALPYESRMAALEHELEELKAMQLTAGATAGPIKAEGTLPRSGGTRLFSVREARQYGVSLALALTPALALLVAAHGVLLFVYDVKPLYLRIASMLIPIPFGFALLVWHPHRFRSSMAGGFAMAAVAVGLMLTTTGLLDSVAIVPQTVREVREVLEYMASIGLAFLTGLLLGKLRYRRLATKSEPGRMVVLLAELFTTDKEGELGVLRLASRIQKMIATLTPIGTGIASVYAGIKALFGDMN